MERVQLASSGSDNFTGWLSEDYLSNDFDTNLVKKQVTQSYNFQFGSTVELIPVFGGELVFNRYN